MGDSGFARSRKPLGSVELRGLFVQGIWRRPTLPHSLPCSTIGAEELNFRVRNGYGWTLFAMVTKKLCETEISTPALSDQPAPHSNRYSASVSLERSGALLHSFTEERVIPFRV